MRKARFKERCKRALRRLIFTGALMASTIMPLGKALAEEASPETAAPAAAEAREPQTISWAAIRPGYAPAQNQAMLRIEGGAAFATGTSFYGFADFQPTEHDSASIDSFYGEARMLQRIHAGLGIYAELDAGSGIGPIFRPGLAYTLTPAGWLIQLRASPWSFGGAEDVQLAAYLNRTFGQRLAAEALLKGDILSRTIYAEVAADILLMRHLSAGLQVRICSDLREGQRDAAPILRASLAF